MNITASRRLRFINLFAFIANIVVMFLATKLVFGKSFPTISEKYPTILTPASWGFSIWLVIFAYEGIMTIAQLFDIFIPAEVVSYGLSCWWSLANIFQALWAVFFSKDSILLATIMVGLTWLCLLKIMLNFHSLRESYYKGSESFISFPSMLFAVFPISIHYAWTLLALLISIPMTIQYNGVSTTEVARTSLTLISLCIIFTAAFSHSFVMKNPDFLVPLTFSWGLLAINDKLTNEKHIDDLFSTTFKDSFKDVSEKSCILFIVFAAFALLKSIRNYLFSASRRKLIYIKQQNEIVPTFRNVQQTI